MTLTFEKISRAHRITVATPVHPYRLDAAHEPIEHAVRITGPAAGFRLDRAGSHDFSCFANLIRTIVPPGSNMTDQQKAVAVYRFCTRNTCHSQIGFGGTEMTRFLNAYGYSFCWGQADFQHLLYEAAGLPARAPVLTGHSSVEVLIDGTWRMIDAYMRLLIPAEDLDGIATGSYLGHHLDRFDQTREGIIVKHARDYWTNHRPGLGTYEPWQDSRAMAITLRRGESLHMGVGGARHSAGGVWCVSPYAPADYLNGRVQWTPTLDEKFLANECDLHENLAASRGRLTPIDPARPCTLDLTLAMPYPLITGKAVLQWDSLCDVTAEISTNQRRQWTVLYQGKSSELSAALDQHLSLRGRPKDDVIASGERLGFVLRLRWTGAQSLTHANIECVLQAHAPSWPTMARGVNAWATIGADAGAQVEHTWLEFPGLTVSDDQPFVGDEVTIRAVVHNRGDKPAKNVRVRFTQWGSSPVLGEATIEQIDAQGSGEATLRWRATPNCGPHNDSGRPNPQYVRTHLRAEVLDQPTTPGESGFACATLRIRPRPAIKFNADLIHTGPTPEHGLPAGATPDNAGALRIRAGVIHHVDPEHIFAYLADAPLDVTVRLSIGDPDHGGVALDTPRRVLDIQPSEFGVAEWLIPTAALPDELDLWVEARGAGQRIVARRAVTIRR